MGIEFVHRPRTGVQPYRPIPQSRYRVRLSFRVDFENGGHLEGEGFLLDLPGPAVAHPEAADMLVSAMSLLRVDIVTIRELEVVPRGAHDDAARNIQR